MIQFDVSSFRRHFPLLTSVCEPKSLVYFDNAATTQKPAVVIDTLVNFYQQQNANVHRASHQLSAAATIAFEQARSRVQQYINANSVKEVIWTKGATESINLVAHSWGLNNLNREDEIVLSYAEHHANIVPWQVVAKQTGAQIKVLPLSKSGQVDIAQANSIITENTKIVALSHISNVIGKVNPVEQVIESAKAVGAKVLIDGSQAIAHLSIDVQKLDCDFYVFSAHKMFGPTGLGVLYGKEQQLKEMPPYQTGGEMIKKVSFSGTSFTDLPFKFEPGTPNIASVVAMATTIEFLQMHMQAGLVDYEAELATYCYQQLSAINGLKFIVDGKPDIPVFAFTIENYHNQDIATAMNEAGFAIRNGHHCAMPLMEYLHLEGCLRVSLSGYNTFDEIDAFVNALNNILHTNVTEPVGSSESKSAQNFQKVLNSFTTANGWDGKHRALMLLGKTLTRMPVENRCDETLISGCESKAWLSFEKNENDHYVFYADSDAKIIRGLLVIVLAAYNHKTKEEILSFDIEHHLKSFGLIAHLSPSRGNGLRAIVSRIKSIVAVA